jgi:AraC family transcriptional regulator
MLNRSRKCRHFSWRFPNDRQPRSTGQISIIPPNTPVEIEVSGGPVTFLQCAFPKDYVDRLMNIGEWTNALNISVCGLFNSFIDSILDRIAQEVVYRRPDSERLLMSLLDCLMIELARATERDSALQRRPGGLANWQIERIRSLIEDPVSGPATTIDELASSCAISARHMTRGFKAATGMTVHNFIAKARMRRAKALLEHPHLMIKEIAAELGFRDPSHFAYEFRRRVGSSPTAYRARVIAH